MEGDSTTEKLTEYKNELDRGIHNVMPDTWKGHGRLFIRDADLSPEKQEKAIAAMSRVMDKNPDYPAEKVASKVIEKLS
jgi:hypothetical protein